MATAMAAGAGPNSSASVMKNVSEIEMVATTDAKRMVSRWLRTPEPHIRDLRPNLLLKLYLLDRRGRSPLPLLEAQQRQLAQTIARLDADETDHEPTALLNRWRLTMAAAAKAFVEDALARHGDAARPHS